MILKIFFVSLENFFEREQHRSRYCFHGDKYQENDNLKEFKTNTLFKMLEQHESHSPCILPLKMLWVFFTLSSVMPVEIGWAALGRLCDWGASSLSGSRWTAELTREASHAARERAAELGAPAYISGGTGTIGTAASAREGLFFAPTGNASGVY